MNEDYDYIVLGTGLKECVLSGLLSIDGKKVLCMDRNSYYGGESASLNLEQLFQRFSPKAAVPTNLGRARDWNVDLCPKFLMACGNLVKLLLHTKVTRYLEFRSVAGSFVVKDKGVHKVPSTPGEALASGLMGFFQKRNFRNFVTFMDSYDPAKPDSTPVLNLDKNKTTSAQLFQHFGLDDNTISFAGHALALYSDDSYLNKPAKEMVERAKLYAYSTARYGNSPYIYPMYGLGGLPEGFSRLAAVHGGTFMLNKPVQEIVYDSDGKVVGVKSEGEVARCKKLIADPSYFLGTDKIKKVGQVVRAIAILPGPVPNTNNADSAQIIIPYKQIPNRKTDLYISVVSYHHQVAASPYWIATISGQVETANPPNELRPAIELLGKYLYVFTWVSDVYEPTSDGSKDNIYISKSFDPESHFETATEDILEMYLRATGKPADLSAKAEDLGQENQ